MMGTFDAFNEYERAMWSSPRADAYAVIKVDLTGHTADHLLDAVGAQAGQRLLDVGTGPGVVAARAIARGCAVTGVDVSPNMLALAATRVPDAEFREGSAESLPCADHEFDAVVGNFVVLHLGYPDRLAAETARVLRPGGRAAFTVWGEAHRNVVLGVFPAALQHAGVSAPADIPEGPLSTTYADHSKFAALLHDGGLVDVEVHDIEWQFTVDPDRWWDSTVSSTPRTGALVARQSPETQRTIRAAYDELITPYLDADGNAVFPVVAVIASGTAPDR